MAGPILLWLARNEPAAYRRARWMLQPKDWLRTRLTGEAATDPTDASGTLLYDLDRDAWAADVAEALGLRTGLLPPIRPSAQVAGTLLPAAAEQLGLRPGLPVATGASDTAASLLAAALPEGWGLLTLGTGGQWIVPMVSRSLDPGTNLFRSVDGGTFRLAGAQNVGVTLDWVAFLLRGQLDYLRAAGSAPAKIMLAGGGSRPPAWRQLLADVLAVPLYPAADPVTGWLTARGAALIAARAAGVATEAGEPGRSGPISAAVEADSAELAEQAYRGFRSARACRPTA
jgi:sugar (pentulose or hexulose) kinase